MGPESTGGMPPVGVFLRDPNPYLLKLRKKTTENSERLGRQARNWIEPGTSRLPALRTEPLPGHLKDKIYNIHLTQGYFISLAYATQMFKFQIILYIVHS